MITKDFYKADNFIIDIEHQNNIINLTISNSISSGSILWWDYMKMRLTKEEAKGLADFINETIGEKKKFAGLRNGKIVEFANDKLSLNHDHIDQIVEIKLG